MIPNYFLSFINLKTKTKFVERRKKQTHKHNAIGISLSASKTFLLVISPQIKFKYRFYVQFVVLSAFFYRFHTFRNLDIQAKDLIRKVEYFCPNSTRKSRIKRSLLDRSRAKILNVQIVGLWCKNLIISFD